MRPVQGGGPYRTATVTFPESLIQEGLAGAEGLEQLGSAPRG